MASTSSFSNINSSGTMMSPNNRSASISIPGGGTRGGGGGVVTPCRKIVLLKPPLAAVGAPSQSAVEEDVKMAAEKLNIPMTVLSDLPATIEPEFISETAFVLPDFTGETLAKLQSAEATLYGPLALREIAGECLGPEPLLPMSTRPLYCTAMRDFVVCFSGYRQRENKKDLKRFLFLIHSMGGRVMGDVAHQKPKITHLVAKDCRGDKYTYATTFDIPVMQDKWLDAAWERRHQFGFRASEENFQNEWKVKPFHGSKIFFLGFLDDEKAHMVSELVRNGGKECTDYQQDPCTHIVVENGSVVTMPPNVGEDTFVVKAEWFWASIQMDACAEENLHLFSEFLMASSSFASPRPSYFSPTSHPGSHGARRKKRRTEAVRQLAQGGDGGVGLSNTKKARSSLGELAAATATSIGNITSASHLLDTPDKNSKDAIKSPLSPRASKSHLAEEEDSAAQIKPLSPRQQIFTELVQTEENYVNILSTIVDIFKKPLEDPKMQLLNQTQMKIIFGNVPPILEVHAKMLADFVQALDNWEDTKTCVGDIVQKYTNDLLRVYPPFVNFFENTKQTLESCDRENPRFHAFLKVCQSKRECGRQTLTELLIRPVQRLGSISLLLNDMLKKTIKTNKEHPDVDALEKALAGLKEVLTNINEDKRKTEGQVHIFEIFSEIDKCPPHLVSSHRDFVCKVDVCELGGSDKLCEKGAELTLFLFTDVLEVAKRRRNGMVRGLGTKSPSTMSLRTTGLQNGGGTNSHHLHHPYSGHQSSQKPHKHLHLMSLTAVRRVVDLVDDGGEECRDSFTLICRTNQENKERMFVFQIVSEDLPKSEFLRLLCRNVANTMYKQDPDLYLVQMRPEDLMLTNEDLAVNSNRAYRSLSRVKKAFSFNKTPTAAGVATSRLSRAVSSMISPLTTSNLVNRERLASTPSGDLQNLRLQSCSNLLDAESPRSTRSMARFGQPVGGSTPLSGRRGTTAGGLTPAKNNPRTFPMAPPPPSPARSLASLNESITSSICESPRADTKYGFSIPRTPQMCVRRASFKFIPSSLGKKPKSELKQ